MASDPPGHRSARSILVLAWVAVLLATVPLPAGAACTPCTSSYALQVRYTAGAVSQQATLTGTAQVADGTLDLDLGPVQSLLAAQVGGGATLDEVIGIALSGGPPGNPLAASDVLRAVAGEVVAWVDTPLGGSSHLHLSTVLTMAQAYPFDYVFTAKGTESPPIAFSFTLTAAGDETFRAPVHKEEAVNIPHFDPDSAECRYADGDVCLPPGCRVTGARLDDHSSYIRLDHLFYSVGDRCHRYHVQVSSTDFKGRTCDGVDHGNCRWCGGWYEGVAVLDGTCDAQRSWSRSVSGSGQVEANPDVDFTASYAASGGALGSGLADAIALFGTPVYTPSLSGCNVGGSPMSCNLLGASMNGGTFTVSTTYSRAVSTAKTASTTLSGTQGTKLLDSLPFTTENGDVQHSVEITFQGRLYRDANGDGFVDSGPFSLWIAGVGNDQLWGAFDRSGVPVATIDSIAPNPALVGQAVQLTGHGSGPFSTYQWLTHRQDQAGGPLLGSAASVTRSDLHPGGHQIRFQVAGANSSPFAYANLAINQPPVAFINHVENVVDPEHPSVALLLRDGVLPDAFEFDGGGIDVDGTIAAYEWTSDKEPGGVIGTSAQFQKALTVLGTHTIALRVRDDAGAWSSPVKTTVTVRRPPVLLVHGLCGSIDSWNDVINQAWLGPEWTTADIVRRTFDPNGDGETNDSPTDMAQLVWQEIQGMKQTYGVRTVDIVAHSMGGLTTRAYVQGPAFQGDVNKLVMLGTPNHGSSIADLTLITNGYTPQDVDLFLPFPRVLKLLAALGVFVEVVDALNVFDFAVCRGQESGALHALRPHGTFLRSLNRTDKDDGTEDFGSSGLPSDATSPWTEYFVVHGNLPTFSHTHLPDSVVQAIRAATLGAVDLTNLSLPWARAGDMVVTDRSARLDGIPATAVARIHRELRETGVPVNQAREYLLDDPPAPPPAGPSLAAILATQPVGGGHGRLAPTLPVDAPRTIEVDAAAARLRVGLSWDREARPLLVLTSPSGVRYETGSPRSGFQVNASGGGLEAAVESPEAGSWQVEVVSASASPGPDNTLRRTAPRPNRPNPVAVAGTAYGWLAFEETGAFVAVGLSADRTAPGRPVTIAAYVQNHGAGVAGAMVRAAVAPPSGRPLAVTLAEDSRFPGLYIGDVAPEASGIYRVLAAAQIPAADGESVTRLGFVSFESELLPDLTIAFSAPSPAPRHGEPVRLTALVSNQGKAPAAAVPVRFFDGLPAARGRLLGERTVDLPAAGASPAVVSVPIPWLATAGAHELVAVVDPANRSGEEDTGDNIAKLSLEVKDTRAPIARAGADQVAVVGQNVIFDGRASSDDDRIVSYGWQPVSGAPGPRPPVGRAQDFRSRQAGGPQFSLNGGYAVLARGFPAPGTYTIRLTVTDASGNAATDDLSVRVVTGFDTTPPSASAGADVTALAGMPVRFDGSGSRDDYGIALATWDTDLARDSDGDGNPANDTDLVGLSPTLASGYERAGVHWARLTVRDAVGNGPATDDLLVTVRRPASRCTVTVPPNSDVNRVLALASPGDTVCLEPARYAEPVVLTTPGVILDGQGAVLENPHPGQGDMSGVVIRFADDAGAVPGATVRNLTVRGFTACFHAASGAGHRLLGDRAENCRTGFSIDSPHATLEDDAAVRCEHGFVLQASGGQMRRSSARGGTLGIQVLGASQILERNVSCGNTTADISTEVAGRAGRVPGGVSLGKENVCDKAIGWTDAGKTGCSSGCAEPATPTALQQ